MEERLENFVNLLNQQRKARPVPQELAKLPNWAQRELLKKAPLNGAAKPKLNGAAINGKNHDAAPQPEIVVDAKGEARIAAKPDAKSTEPPAQPAVKAAPEPEGKAAARPVPSAGDKLRDPQSLLAQILAEETKRQETTKAPVIINATAEKIEPPIPVAAEKPASEKIAAEKIAAEKITAEKIGPMPLAAKSPADQKIDKIEPPASATDKVAPKLTDGAEIAPLLPVIAETLASPPAGRRPMAYALAAAAVIAVVALVAGGYWYTHNGAPEIATIKTVTPSVTVARKQTPPAVTKSPVVAEHPKASIPAIAEAKPIAKAPPAPKVAEATPAAKATPAPKVAETKPTPSAAPAASAVPAPTIAEAKPTTDTTPKPAAVPAEAPAEASVPAPEIAAIQPDTAVVAVLTPAPTTVPVAEPAAPDVATVAATPKQDATPSAPAPAPVVTAKAAPEPGQIAMLTPPPPAPAPAPKPLPAPAPATTPASAALPVAPAPKPAPAAMPAPPPVKPVPVQAAMPAPPPMKPAVAIVAPPRQALPAGAPTWRRNAVPAPPFSGQPRIAIVMDDLGLDRDRTTRAIALAGPVTLSFLAYASDLPQQTEAARRAGHELIVHVPMEPVMRSKLVSQAAAGSSPAAQAELLRRLRWDLSRFTGYVGVNNHLGNRLSSDPDSTNTVIAELKARGLLFLDSRPGGAVLTVAAQQGVPTVTRDVLLDDDVAATSVKERLAKVERVARERGTAIAIGHPHDKTLEALQTWIAELPSKGLQLVPLTAIVKDREQHPTTATN